MLKKLMLIVAVAALATVSIAQPRGGGMFGRGAGAASPTTLLQRADVQEDLKLTDEQKTKLSDMQTDMREQMRSAFQDAGQDRAAAMKVMQKLMETSAKKANDILTDDQKKRLKEIFVQISGNSAILNADVQKDLGMMDDQITKIKDLQKKQQEASTKIMEKMRSGEIDRDQIQEIMTKNQKAMDTELGKILTDDQKKKLSDMGGKPFKKADDN